MPESPTPRAVLATAPFLPVVTIDEAASAVPLAQALLEGGIGIVEVALRTPASLDAVERIARGVPGILVGAGTLLGTGRFRPARDAGARFLVSPGTTFEMLKTGRDIGVPYFPGTATPSEVLAARAAGFSELKFFPAGPGGGTDALRCLAEVFPDISFCPTGGIDGSNFRAFLALPNVACVGGAWVAPRELIRSRDWAAIADRARQAAGS